jgi:tetratricopeptide (TPR) repeat protein
LADAFVAEGEIDRGLAEYQAAIRLDPLNAVAHNNAGAALLRKGDTEAALRHLAMALRVGSASGDTYYNVGRALGLQGHFDRAIDALRAALQLQPAGANILAELARVLAKSGGGRDRIAEAFDLAERAVRLTSRRDWDALDALAAAHAAAGRFEQAADAAAEALSLVLDQTAAYALANRLRVYRARAGL